MNIQIVLNNIQAHLQDSSKLTYQDLTYKLVILMALMSTSRASAFHHLDISYMTRDKQKLIFAIIKLHKSWKGGKAQPSLEFHEYKNGRDFLSSYNP